ncbi:MAG: helix-turn-helix domain-containing protein, partial [Candidatus Ornithomonoglobus sp.]
MVTKLLDKDYFDNEKQFFADFCVEHREMNMHSHEFWEISYVYEGRGTNHTADGGRTGIKEGEFLFISPGAEHCITSPPPEKGGWVRVCNFLMSQRYIDEVKKAFLGIDGLDEYSLRKMIADNKPFCIQIADDSGSVHNLLMTAAHEYKHFTHGSDVIIRNTSLALLISISRLYERGLKNDTTDLSRNEVIDDLLRYIKSNIGANLSLDYLAAYAHLSPSYLSRYFKKYTGKNLSDFLIEERMERAKHMLRSSSHSINDISLYCGYQTVGNFSRVF